MPRELTPQTNLDVLRKEAKRWLKALQAGEADALRRYRETMSAPAEAPKLRQVQQALAREYDFPSWAALAQEIGDRARTHAERVVLFLEKGVHRFGTDPRTGKWGSYERDSDARGAMAARLLKRDPQIAREDIHTAVLAHDLDLVRTMLAKSPALAKQQHAFDGWTPLARLAYARLPIPQVGAHALEIATLLLDAGADPKLAASGDLVGFTILTGVIGSGEAGQSPHPLAEDFARLLIARGADPLDGQALYNTSLGADDTFWLDLLWTASEARGETARWNETTPNLIGSALSYLLGNAVPNHPKRVAWLLAHGANARVYNAYSKQPVVKHARMAGKQEMVALLEEHGAERIVLTGVEAVVAAAMHGEANTLRELVKMHPESLRSPEPMFAAINQHRTDVAEMLLDLGTSPDVGDDKDFRALHQATHAGAIGIAELLIARGADVDALERRYNSTPLGHATYQERRNMVDLIAPLSRDIAGLCWSGSVTRLAQLLGADPSLANTPSRGALPLFSLPDDDERALEVVELLLAHGADANATDAEGKTPAQAAAKRGLEDAAEMLSSAER